MSVLKNDIHESIIKSEQLLNNVKELKINVMKKFLGINEDADLSDVYRSGLTAVKWKTQYLHELFVNKDLVKGMDESQFSGKFSEKSCPVIKREYIKKLRFMPGSYQYIQENEIDDDHLIQGGDIILAIDGEDPGASTVLPFMHEKSILGNGLVSLRVDNDICEVFYMLNILHFYYNTNVLNDLIAVNTDSCIQNLLEMLIPLPPIDEQKKIADYMLQLSGFMIAGETYCKELDKLEMIAKQAFAF